MDISGLGESVVAQLVELRLVGDVADLYSLNELLLARLDRIGTKSIDNYLKAIEASKKQDPWRLVFGLGILHVGAGGARKLLEHFGSIDAIAAASVEDLTQCPDIDGVVAPSIHSWFHDETNINLLQRLRDAGLNFAPGRSGTHQALSGTMKGAIVSTVLALSLGTPCIAQWWVDAGLPIQMANGVTEVYVETTTATMYCTGDLWHSMWTPEQGAHYCTYQNGTGPYPTRSIT